MKKRKQYSNEFKAEAVAMVTEHERSISDVSDSLGIGHTALRRWVKLYGHPSKANSGSQDNVMSAEKQRIQELEKQVKTLQKERDVLKKSIAFVCHEHVDHNVVLNK